MTIVSGTPPGKVAPGNSASTPKEKVAGMLETSTTTSKELSTCILWDAEKTGKQARKEYATLQAKFARLGRVLNGTRRAHDGRISFIVSHRGESRHYAHRHDVVAHLAALMEMRP